MGVWQGKWQGAPNKNQKGKRRDYHLPMQRCEFMMEHQLYVKGMYLSHLLE
jgi:hypothetical protein